MEELPRINIFLGKQLITDEWTKVEKEVKVRAREFWIRHGQTNEIAVIKEIRRIGDSMEESVKVCGFPTFQDIQVKVQYADGEIVESSLDNQFEILNEHLIFQLPTKHYAMHPIFEILSR
ncbi:MAG: hypothetical protein ABID61_04965 [Candidatus Micrarchaeota archaeon]|uniref:Uncharacterized protein n=1 Tax=viral metagenome TaxID=1070528 RepID=A0A6M3JZT8_9ZZZZ